MPWYYAVAERDHEFQNPTSAEKIVLLGERLRLSPQHRVLDAACGKCGPAILLAQTYGCRIVGVDNAPEFVAAARERISSARVFDLVEVHAADAASFSVEPETFDAALCLGASFVWGSIADAARALAPAVRPGGTLAVGEPYWRRWPLPPEIDPEAYVTFPETVARFESAGVTTTALIDSSLDDWDRYETLHWRAVEEWLAAHADDPDAEQIRARHEHTKGAYLRFRRDLLGWAILVGAKPS